VHLGRLSDLDPRLERGLGPRRGGEKDEAEEQEAPEHARSLPQLRSRTHGPAAIGGGTRTEVLTTERRAELALGPPSSRDCREAESGADLPRRDPCPNRSLRRSSG